MKKIFFFLCGLSFVAVSAQKTHKVEAKENPYSIAKKYGVSVEELLKQNPKFKDGKLNIGDVLTIPKVAKNTENQPKKQEKPLVKTPKLGKIYLQPKQTIYGITKQYRITEEELKKLNPNLEMKIGEEIVLPEENIKKYGGVVAQKPIETPLKKEEKKEVVRENEAEFYTIQPKDTYYGITKKLGITQKELFALNPDLEEKGLQPNEKIRVKGKAQPIVNQSKKEVKTQTHSVEEWVTHTMQKGDTAFGIIGKYNISYDQLLELNEQLPNGIKEGMELKIRKYERRFIKTDDDVFNVVLMLPFGYDSNDNKYRNLATDFLIGAKLAAERNTAKGKKISLNVIDAENENSFKNSLSQINKTNTDLIIGPFFKSNVLEVLHYVKNEKIPVVAPFAHTEDLYDYQNLVLVETSARVYSERIAREVKQVYANQKIYIVGDKMDNEVDYLKTRLSKELSKVNIEVVSSALEIDLEQNMMTGKKAPAIVILANNDDNAGRNFAKKIIELGKETEGIKAFSLYYHTDFEKNIDGLSQTNLVYLMDRKINTDGSFEKQVLKDFNAKYCKTPSKYTIIGFDVMNDMLSRENNGEVLKHIEKTQTQLATKFEYVRSKKNGAYINTGYRVVRLIP